LTNKQNVTPANNAVVVSLTFSNVVPANNDWITFDFFAVANDGSKTYLGTLGTLIDITGTGATANLDDASTRRLQVALAMLQRGVLSSYDIENTAALDANLGTAIGSAPFDAQTELFDPAPLQALVTQIQPAYERDLVLTADSLAVFSVTYDYTRADENDLAFNVQSTYLIQPNGPQVPVEVAGPGTYAFGAPFTPAGSTGAIPILHGPSSGFGHATPSAVTAFFVGQDSNTVTVRNVYGGALILGAKQELTFVSDSVVFVAHGSNASLAGRAVGSSSQALTTAPGTGANPQFNDPQLTAFGAALIQNARPPFTASALALPNTGGSVPTYVTKCAANHCPDTLIPFPTNGQPTEVEQVQNGGLSLDIWSPFGLTAANQQICGPVGCAPLSSAPLNVRTSFFDPGSNLSYYHWAGSGAPGDTTTNVTQVSTGYAVTHSGTSGSIVSTTPAIFPAHASAGISCNIVGGTWTLSIVANGVTYTATGIGGALTFPSLPQTVTSSKITFTYQLPAGQGPGTFVVSSMQATPPDPFQI